MIGDKLNIYRKISYGVGHVLNDLCASMWFSYLLIYLHRIVLFDDLLAGYMMLVGQIADALSTTFVGFESDRTVSGLFNYGRRKTWHLVGCFSVLISFPFLYNVCIGCSTGTPNWAKFIYYAPFVIIFQFGWAATQISHLSLIPQLTPNENERVALNSIRYAFTVMSNIFVYGVTFLLLQYNDNSSQEIIPIDTSTAKDINVVDNNLNPSDAPKFMILTFIVCGVGLLFQIIFHVGTKEKKESNDQIENGDQSCVERERARSFVMQETLDWRGYIKTIRFYQVAVLYMCTRLIVNISQVYLPMYITDTVVLEKSFIAIVPLISYVSGFVSSFAMRYINRLIGRNLTYALGAVQIGIFCVLMWYKKVIFNFKVNALVASVLLGSGGSTILITSLSMTTDLIGHNTNSGAFVYGAMSFTDKLSNGIVVALLQQFSPCSIHTSKCKCAEYYQYIMTFLPSVCCVVALLSILSLNLTKKRMINSSVNTDEPNETTPILNANTQIN